MAARTAARWLLTAGATVSAPALGWAALQEHPLRSLSLVSQAPVRLARDAAAAALTVVDYKWSLPAESSPEYEQQLHLCHERGAERLLDLCFRNGGIYIKLGQHIGQLDHLLPGEYVTKMRDHLLDKCPVSSWSEVRSIMKEDFGMYPEEMFVSIEETPIASASLAQVHVAHDEDGRKLAVKVQHAGLREMAAVDTLTIEALVHGVRWLCPDFNYQWLVDEVKENLPMELDFEHEAANARRCAQNLASPRSVVGKHVAIPKVDSSRLSNRVLTMDFMEGCSVTDILAIEAMGLKLSEVAQMVSQTFAEMIFIHGDVHCDPHAANVLVRRGRAGRPELVLLDHGLYRVIDDNFRREYAALWQALILADHEGIKRHSASMNAGDAYPLFAAMLTTRPWDQITRSSIDHLFVPGTEEDKQTIQKYAHQYAREISDLLLRIPRALLLLLKTNDCLRSVDTCLGQPVNTYIITARWCTKALSETQSHSSIAERASAFYKSMMLEWKVALMRVSAWIARWQHGAEYREMMLNSVYTAPEV
mmetsp:Transcript_20714/g.53084  ORF Transcript_20714/g.53084 Transcript_20714/m.53084 type:complete len:534 (+) Transcript_20714:223-1824(+)